MLKFNNFPPKKPEDVEWAPGAESLLAFAVGDPNDSYDVKRKAVKALGRSVGALLAATMTNPSRDVIVNTAWNLTDKTEANILSKGANNFVFVTGVEDALYFVSAEATKNS